MSEQSKKKLDYLEEPRGMRRGSWGQEDEEVCAEETTKR